MRRLSIAAAALLTLAACKPGPSTEESARRTGEIRLENTSIEEVAKQTVAAAEKNRAKPGQWENSTQLVSVEAPGTPPALLKMYSVEAGKPPQVMRICKRVEDPQAIDFGRLASEQKGCTVPRYVIADGKVDLNIHCPGPFGGNKVTIAGTQTPEAYDVTVIQDATAPGGGHIISKVHLTGKRTGDCKA